MTIYHYKACDKTGKPIEGTMEAASDDAVAAKLNQMGYIPVTIATARGEQKIRRTFILFRGVGASDLNMFTRQLATLQKAGLPLLSSLNALARQTSHATLKNVIEQTAKDIEGGSTFSNALARHPRIFNALYTNMVKSGEASGKLAETLERLALLGEHEEKIRLRIKAAVRYPAIVVIAIILGFLILVTLVIPRFAKVYGQLGAALPLPTRILIGIHYAMTQYWWLLIIVGCIAGFLFYRFVNTPQGRRWWDAVKLRVPVFGPLLLKLTLSRFARVTGTLMHSGVPIMQILDLVTESVDNVVVGSAIQKIKTSVGEGKGMREPMQASNLFPPAVVEMVAVGEQTGKIDTLLIFVSDYYDSQVDYTIDNLVSLIEPVLIFILGCVVLLMALGIFLPMWNLMHVFQR